MTRTNAPTVALPAVARPSKSLQVAASESTCAKRVTVCALYDGEGNLLAVESNRCSPPGRVCGRLDVANTKQDYPSTASCNWEHAERRALAALPAGSAPRQAVLHGHDFYCNECEAALVAAGVVNLTIARGSGIGGLR